MLSEAERRFRRNLLEWEQENRREYPWRESNRTLYEVFVAEFFLTQTLADNVATVYSTLLERFPTLNAIAEVSEEELVEVIESRIPKFACRSTKQIASSRPCI